MTRIVYATLYETPVMNHSLKVNRGRPSLPMLLLNEEWIKEAGFKIGGSLVVRIEPGKLVIIPDKKEVIP